MQHFCATIPLAAEAYTLLTDGCVVFNVHKHLGACRTQEKGSVTQEMSLHRVKHKRVRKTVPPHPPAKRIEPRVFGLFTAPGLMLYHGPVSPHPTLQQTPTQSPITVTFQHQSPSLSALSLHQGPPTYWHATTTTDPFTVCHRRHRPGPFRQMIAHCGSGQSSRGTFPVSSSRTNTTQSAVHVDIDEAPP